MDNTDARKRWAMLALLFAARVGLGFQFQTMGSVADPVAARLGLSGVTYAAFRIAQRVTR
jgi:hypothetical protein